MSLCSFLILNQQNLYDASTKFLSWCYWVFLSGNFIRLKAIKISTGTLVDSLSIYKLTVGMHVEIWFSVTILITITIYQASVSYLLQAKDSLGI